MSLPPDYNNDSDSIDDGITYYNLRDLVAEYDAQCQNDADTPNGVPSDVYISYTPIGREPFLISSNSGPLNQRNSSNNHEDAAPDTESFTPGTHLNDLVCNNYVQEQRRDTGYLLPNVVNQPTSPLQQLSIESTDGAFQMNSHYSANTQNYDSFNELFRDTASYSLPNVVNQPATALQQPNTHSTDEASQMNSHYSATTQNCDSYNELFRDTAAYSLPNVVNQPAAPLQQPNTQSTDEASQMNSDSSANTQNYVQPNNQQPHFVAQPIPTAASPSQISGPFYIELSKKSALKVCTTQDYEKETGRTLSRTPMLPKAQNMNPFSCDPKPFRLHPETASAIQQSQTSNTLISGLPQNNINIVNVNTIKSNPIPRNIKILPKQVQHKTVICAIPKEKPDKGSSQPIASSGPKDSSLPTNSGMEVDTDLETKSCNCTKSQCLKLYCECFRRGKFCQNCKCIKCLNNVENEQLRSEAIRSCLQRKPNAFLTKVGKVEALHKKGCNCKRSGCLKKYCECFNANIPCSSKCKCVSCLNRSTEENVSEEVPRVNIEDVPKLIVETTDSDSSERSGEDNGPVAELFTEDVRDSLTEYMLRAAAEVSDEREQLSKVMEAFSKKCTEIFSRKRKIGEVNCEGTESSGTEEE